MNVAAKYRDTDRYIQIDRYGTPEAQPWRVPRQEEWNLSCFRDMNRHPSDMYILFVKSQSQQEPRRKETHHPNTYTHPGMHIVPLYSESWESESGTSLLMQRGSHNYWHHMIITQSLSPYKWLPASFTHRAQSEPNRTSAVSNICSGTPSWLFTVQL